MQPVNHSSRCDFAYGSFGTGIADGSGNYASGPIYDGNYSEPRIHIDSLIKTVRTSSEGLQPNELGCNDPLYSQYGLTTFGLTQNYGIQVTPVSC